MNQWKALAKTTMITIGPRQWARWALNAALFASLALILWVVGTLIHEIGHGITGELLGARISGIYLYPGVEIYPHFGRILNAASYNSFGSMSFSSAPVRGPSGLIDLMGSGSTLIIALVAQGLLWWLRPQKRLPRHALIILSLFYLDMVTYTLNPALGLPRAVFVGRRDFHPEPLEGAVAMGIPAWAFYLFNVIILVGLSYGLLRHMTQPSEPDAALINVSSKDSHA